MVGHGLPPTVARRIEVNFLSADIVDLEQGRKILRDNIEKIMPSNEGIQTLDENEIDLQYED